jgi:hypothetical protein
VLDSKAYADLRSRVIRFAAMVAIWVGGHLVLSFIQGNHIQWPFVVVLPSVVAVFGLWVWFWPHYHRCARAAEALQPNVEHSSQ